MCLAQAHNTVTPVRLEPATLRSLVKHSTTEPRSIVAQSVCARLAIATEFRKFESYRLRIVS